MPVIYISTEVSRTVDAMVLQPGVEALGYVNSTTPALLLSTSFASVVFSPSFVSISPPKPERSMLSPCFGGPALLDFSATSSTFSLAASAIASSVTGSATGSSFLALLFGAAFFFAGGGAA